MQSWKVLCFGEFFFVLCWFFGFDASGCFDWSFENFCEIQEGFKKFNHPKNLKIFKRLKSLKNSDRNKKLNPQEGELLKEVHEACADGAAI